jgi:hypothetical protein
VVRGVARLAAPGKSAVQVQTDAGTNVDLLRVVGQMIYGIVCFGMLFSFVGTVLGGLWADVSWGRFWGWDPKENGALLIVIWNALVLHARWAGWVKTPGVARLAVLGAVVTCWSWFGTNQLGVGLHAYGFNKGLVLVMQLDIAICLLVLVFDLLVQKVDWRKLFAPPAPPSDGTA